MKLKHLLLISAVAMSFAACDDDDDNNNVAEASGKILFSTTVTNPDGSSGSGYLQAVSEFEGGVNYTNTNAIPLGFGSYPCVCKSGNIYVFPDYMGGTELKLRRFVLNDANQLELKGSMALPANSSAAIVVEASDKKAYVCCQSLDLIVVFNPETMTEISRIDVSSLRNEGVSAYPGAMYIRDGILYVALEQFNAQCPSRLRWNLRSTILPTTPSSRKSATPRSASVHQRDRLIISQFLRTKTATSISIV